MPKEVRVAWVRGAFMNMFEGQNYAFERGVSLTGFGSLAPIQSELPFPVVRLPSPPDFMPHIAIAQRALKIICNRTLGDMHLLWGLERTVRDFDIAHTADPYYYYSYQLARMRRSGTLKRLIVTSWETIPFNNETVARKRWIKRFVLDNADLFLCYTRKAADALIVEGVAAEKIRTVNLGVDLARFRPQRRKPGPVTVLTVGRLVPEKGMVDVYEAFRVASREIQAQLLIVGDGPQRQDLLRMVERDGLTGRVRIETHRYDRMHEVYARADIFALASRATPTWEEQYGMVLVEALASGLPIVAAATGAIPEVVGDAGVLASDSESFMRELREMIERVDVREKLARKARERAEGQFDAAKTRDKIGRIYQMS